MVIAVPRHPTTKAFRLIGMFHVTQTKEVIWFGSNNFLPFACSASSLNDDDNDVKRISFQEHVI